MAGNYNLYPLSSPSGIPIPNEIAEPIAHVRQAISTSAMGSPLNFTTEELELIAIGLYTSVDCVISFDQTTPVNNISGGVIFLPAGSYTQIKPASKFISVIGSAAGNLDINIMKLWDTLATDIQLQQG